MKKIIFGVFPSRLSSVIKASEAQGHIISDKALYKTLASMVSSTARRANNSVIQTLEYVGLPTATAHTYKEVSTQNKKTLLAAVVPLDMEEKIRELFKKFQGNNIATINYP